ncbi:MAG: class I SAM-dependent methyltransferase [Gammaproteobacteria bacterium]|jgi:SAM-dependent methyltransferase|nr:class I SAM-dependent methyltransferase [Gammaproteobacteria bacterium]
MSGSDEQFEYTGSDNLEVMLEAENYNRFLTDQVLANRVGGGALLDFGAGIGTFAEMVQARGVQVHCLEPDGTQGNLLRAKGFETFASSDDIAAESYDYIYSLNVFEHIEDDGPAARDAYRLLKPGGCLFIYVPAFQLLFGSMDRKVGHFRRYRRLGLLQLVRNAGFEAERCAYADCIGFFATLAYNLKPGDDGGINPATIKLYDRVLFPVSRVIDRLTSSFIGKNVFVRAIKPR